MFSFPQFSFYFGRMENFRHQHHVNDQNYSRMFEKDLYQDLGHIVTFEFKSVITQILLVSGRLSRVLLMLHLIVVLVSVNSFAALSPWRLIVTACPLCHYLLIDLNLIVLGNTSVKAFWWTSFFISSVKHDLILMYLYQLWCSRMVMCLSLQDICLLSPVGGLKSAACLWQCLGVRVWLSSPSPQTRRANGPYCVRFWVFCAAVQCVLCLRIWKRSWRTSTQLLGWIKPLSF